MAASERTSRIVWRGRFPCQLHVQAARNRAPSEGSGRRTHFNRCPFSMAIVAGLRRSIEVPILDLTDMDELIVLRVVLGVANEPRPPTTRTMGLELRPVLLRRRENFESRGVALLCHCVPL